MDPAPKSLMERLAERKRVVQPRPDSSASVSEDVADNSQGGHKVAGKTATAQARSTSLGPATSRGTGNPLIYSFL